MGNENAKHVTSKGENSNDATKKKDRVRINKRKHHDK